MIRLQQGILFEFGQADAMKHLQMYNLLNYVVVQQVEIV